MAIDPEELKRRRYARIEQRRLRQRRMWIRLGIAAVVLLLCGILIFVLLPRQDQQPEDNAPVTQDTADTEQTTGETTPTDETAQTQETAETEEVSNTTTIHLAFAGDVNVTDKVVNSGGAEYDYTSVFMDIAHILADADLTAVNFEGNLCGPAYGTNSASAPQELMEAMDRAGVDLVQLANSYSINQGISGLVSTINGVRAAGMEPLGVYEDQSAYKRGRGYTIVTVQGIEVAFVAFTKGMDGMALPPGSENCVNLLYTDYESTYQNIDTTRISDILDAVAQEKPDLTVAMLHWGSEYNDSVSDSQEDIVALMQAQGVDAIIGTHSHFVHQMDYDTEAGTFVAYSMGDLLGDAERSGTQYSVILDLEVTKDKRSGNTTISGFSYTPIYTVTENRTNLRILRIREALLAYDDSFIDRITATAYADMEYALSRIESRISGEG